VSTARRHRSSSARTGEQDLPAKGVELEGATHFRFNDRDKEAAEYILEFLDDEE
jgi:hypothetical protein